jgi:serine/threonine protein kinase
MNIFILCAAICGASLGTSHAQDDEKKHPFHRGPRLLLGRDNEVSLYSRIGYTCDPTEKCHDKVAIDHNGDVKEVLPFELAPVHGKVEPFPGMLLYVQEKRNEKVVQDYGIERRATGKVNIYHRPCCNLYGSSGSAEKVVGRYELIEVVGGELGSTIVHKHDFAYRPVFALSSEANKEWGKGGYWWDNQMFHHHEENYEREGHRAFAGGSHGEVWKARRKCHKILVNVGKKNQASDHHSHYDRDRKLPCDVYEDLIMKRLLVGKSYDLLEAGLREIYFGEILSRNEESTSLFTSYVDHFFHQSPRNNMKDLELWVVFINAGPSLRSLLYSPVENAEFVMYQHSAFWIQLRTGGPIKKHGEENYSVALRETLSSDNNDFAGIHNEDEPDDMRNEEADEVVDGQDLLKSVLRQLFTSASKLHERGIVHRDIKPSNIMCDVSLGVSKITCRLGDFSSAYDEYASEHLYLNGPSRAEQTDEYAPPESLFGDDDWIPFDALKPESYDSWSLGIVVLELLLGTPHVFSVDKRTTAILTKKLTDEGASDEDIRRALYLSALAQFCIYQPTFSKKKKWPLREGDPLFKTVSESS